MKAKGGFVYILTNFGCTTFYVGVTSNLQQRLAEHGAYKYPGSFTARYNCTFLVYYEVFAGIEAAIHREKVLKAWPRARKLALIRKQNPWMRFYDPAQLPPVAGSAPRGPIP